YGAAPAAKAAPAVLTLTTSEASTVVSGRNHLPKRLIEAPPFCLSTALCSRTGATVPVRRLDRAWLGRARSSIRRSSKANELASAVDGRADRAGDRRHEDGAEHPDHLVAREDEVRTTPRRSLQCSLSGGGRESNPPAISRPHTGF